MNRFHTSIDCALVALAVPLAFALRNPEILLAFELGGIGLYLILTLAVSAIVFSATRFSKRVWRYFSFIDVFRVASIVALAVLIAWSMTFLINRSDYIPRSIPLFHWAIAVFLIFTVRAGVRLFRPRTTRNVALGHVSALEHVLVIGSSDLAELYLRCAKTLGAGRVSIAGILDTDAAMTGRFLSHVPVLGRPTDIADIINEQAVHGVDIDRVVVAMAFRDLDESSREALRSYEKRSGTPLEFFEERLGFNNRPAPPVAAPVTVQPVKAYARAKRLIDITGALVLLTVLSPLIVMVWIATLLDVGSPAYFWQLRPGLRGKSFRVLKFRSMRGAHDKDGNRIPDDQRSSIVGETLRRYRLDELPQLFNVLKGDMSFIGPRPLLPVDQPNSSAFRLSVRPGLSGWAQVNGGRHLSIADKAALDAWYVENMSLMLDIKITLLTMRVVMFGEQLPSESLLSQAHRVAGRLQSAP